MEVLDEQRDEGCCFSDLGVELEHDVLKRHHMLFKIIVPFLYILTELCLVQILSLVVGCLENLLDWQCIDWLNNRLE